MFSSYICLNAILHSVNMTHHLSFDEKTVRLDSFEHSFSVSKEELCR